MASRNSSIGSGRRLAMSCRTCLPMTRDQDWETASVTLLAYYFRYIALGLPASTASADQATIKPNIGSPIILRERGQNQPLL